MKTLYKCTTYTKNFKDLKDLKDLKDTVYKVRIKQSIYKKATYKDSIYKDDLDDLNHTICRKCSKESIDQESIHRH